MPDPEERLEEGQKYSPNTASVTAVGSWLFSGEVGRRGSAPEALPLFQTVDNPLRDNSVPGRSRFWYSSAGLHVHAGRNRSNRRVPTFTAYRGPPAGPETG